MHGKRLAVALVLLPLIYLYIVKLSPGFFLALVVVVSALAQWEFCAMYRVGSVLRVLGVSAGVVTLGAMHDANGWFPGVLVLSFLVIATVRLLGKRDPSSSLHELSPVFVGILYIPCSLALQLPLRGEGPGWIILLMGSVWASDSLAYYVGRSVGKEKLYVEVSPNKTVAGAFGSLAGGALSCVLLNELLHLPLRPWEAGLVGILVGASTVVGDLVESMFKRDAGVKDSGSMVPGHGGILDKIDGMLFAGPVLYWTSRFFLHMR